jgi:hypothetical protein
VSNACHGEGFIVQAFAVADALGAWHRRLYKLTQCLIKVLD